MKKFELTSEHKINWCGRTLYRIKACISFTTTNGYEVNEGDLGGWVEKESNLSHEGKGWIWGNAKICGDANIFSTKHIFNVTPIGCSANSLTVFRTKNCEIAICFEWDLYSVDGFKSLVEAWENKEKSVALMALDVALVHIDKTPAEPEWKPCPFCGGNSELDSDADIVVCQKCGSCSPKENWNERV